MRNGETKMSLYTRFMEAWNLCNYVACGWILADDVECNLCFCLGCTEYDHHTNATLIIEDDGGEFVILEEWPLEPVEVEGFEMQNGHMVFDNLSTTSSIDPFPNMPQRVQMLLQVRSSRSALIEQIGTELNVDSEELAELFAEYNRS